MALPRLPVFHLLLGLASAQLDCGNCYHLNPGAIAGVVLGDLLLTLLIAVAVYYVASCFYRRQLASSALVSPVSKLDYVFHSGSLSCLRVLLLALSSATDTEAPRSDSWRLQTSRSPTQQRPSPPIRNSVHTDWTFTAI